MEHLGIGKNLPDLLALLTWRKKPSVLLLLFLIFLCFSWLPGLKMACLETGSRVRTARLSTERGKKVTTARFLYIRLNRCKPVLLL
jgi:hypothetical protein